MRFNAKSNQFLSSTTTARHHTLFANYICIKFDDFAWVHAFDNEKLQVLFFAAPFLAATRIF